MPPQVPFDLAQPGWKVFQGQATWRPKTGASEIAGELLVAVNADGRGFAQFTKNPLPMVLAQLDGRRWQIEFPADNRRYSGHGERPQRLLWLFLLDALNDPQLAPTLIRDDGRLLLEDSTTGEQIDGYLAPDRMPVQP